MTVWSALVTAWNSMCAFFAALFGGTPAAAADTTRTPDLEQQPVPAESAQAAARAAEVVPLVSVRAESPQSEPSDLPTQPKKPVARPAAKGEGVTVKAPRSAPNSDGEEDDAKCAAARLTRNGRSRSGAFYDGTRPAIGPDGRVRVLGGRAPPLARLPALKQELPPLTQSALVPCESSSAAAADMPADARASCRFVAAVADTIGLRDSMEDAHSMCGRLGGSDTQDAYMVFDGHNGADAAAAANARMPAILCDKLAKGVAPDEALRVCASLHPNTHAHGHVFGAENRRRFARCTAPLWRRTSGAAAQRPWCCLWASTGLWHTWATRAWRW